MPIQVDMHDVAAIKKSVKHFETSIGGYAFVVQYIDCYDDEGDCLLHVALFNKGDEPTPIEEVAS
jgi:hypothetical protein